MKKKSLLYTIALSIISISYLDSCQKHPDFNCSRATNYLNSRRYNQQLEDAQKANKLNLKVINKTSPSEKKFVPGQPGYNQWKLQQEAQKNCFKI